MCGYIGNLHESPAVIDLFNRLQLPLPYPVGQSYMMREVEGHLAAGADGYQLGRAIWWYALKWQNHKLVPNQEITSFNARNLQSKLWRKPINERRGLVFATEIGETQGRAHYLMRARTPLAIGTLYQDYRVDAAGVNEETEAAHIRSFALITRPAHPRFAPYHEKAMPLFLPLDAALLAHWLDPSVPADDPQISNWLQHPRITADLEVTPVKTFKRAEALGETEFLAADEDLPAYKE